MHNHKILKELRGRLIGDARLLLEALIGDSRYNGDAEWKNTFDHGKLTFTLELWNDHDADSFKELQDTHGAFCDVKHKGTIRHLRTIFKSRITKRTRNHFYATRFSKEEALEYIKERQESGMSLRDSAISLRKEIHDNLKFLVLEGITWGWVGLKASVSYKHQMTYQDGTTEELCIPIGSDSLWGICHHYDDGLEAISDEVFMVVSEAVFSAIKELAEILPGETTVDFPTIESIIENLIK